MRCVRRGPARSRSPPRQARARLLRGGHSRRRRRPDPGHVLLSQEGQSRHLAVLLGEEEPVRVEGAVELRPVRVPARVRPGRRRQLSDCQSSQSRVNGSRSTSCRDGLSCGRGQPESGEEVAGAQVLEGMEVGPEGANVGHITIERSDRPAQCQVARGPCVRPREMAREEPVRRPFAEPAQGDETRVHVVVREGTRARPGRGRLRASSRTYSALRGREAEADELVVGRPRHPFPLGKANACPRGAVALESLLLIAAADCSETCWAVTAVTSASKGSGGSGGRKPARATSSRARTSSAAAQGRSPPGRRAGQESGAPRARSSRRAARRRHLRAPPRSGPCAPRRRGGCRLRARGSPGRARNARNRAGRERRSRTAGADERAQSFSLSQPPSQTRRHRA